MTMCPAATKLSNTLRFVKASYCEGEIDTEGRRSRWPLCPSYLPSLPSTPIWRVKSTDPKLTVNWLVMVAKASRHQSIRFSPRLSEEAFSPVLLGLINWPSCYPASGALEKSWLWSNVCLRDSQEGARLKAYIWRICQHSSAEGKAGCNENSWVIFLILHSCW